MGIFDSFKKPKLDKQVQNIFDGWTESMEASKLVDQAISYRNLGQYDKAISILKQSINKYPMYLPARTVLGVTLRTKGDIGGAEEEFKRIIIEQGENKTYPLIEVYANLGALYYFDRKDVNRALAYYDLALKQPRPETLDFPEGAKYYEMFISNVYRDLCLIYFHEKNFPLAKRYALNRLESVKTCLHACKVFGQSVLTEYIQGYAGFKYITEEIENKDFMYAMECLDVAVSENPQDYTNLSAMVLVLCFLRQMKYYRRNPNLINSFEKKHKHYEDRLVDASETSEEARRCLGAYLYEVKRFVEGLERNGITL